MRPLVVIGYCSAFPFSTFSISSFNSFNEISSSSIKEEMPSPKAGTVTPDVAKAVQESKAGKIEYRLDKTNIIHCPIGKVSFGAEKLAENFNAIMGAIVKAKPAAAKGQYIKSCVVASTMGPGVKVNGAKLV